MFQDALIKLKEQVKDSAILSGRAFNDIEIIAVTKTRTLEEMKAVAKLGLTSFGENKVQELQSKYNDFDENINWHLIGHLQRNKVKYIIDKVSLIHSVDSLRLAETISLEAKKQNIVARILVQVNVANEDTKFGIKISEAEAFIKEIGLLQNIKVEGLMTIAPYTLYPEENRKYFRALKQLSVDINKQRLDNISMNILSMGMTNDFQVAIEEGATMIRVGTGIFGERDY